METTEMTVTKKTKEKVQLVKGEFTASETYDIILALIDEKINFHKLQRLQLWEGNHRCKTDQLDGRIKELSDEKQKIKEYLINTRANNKKYEINGVLEIKMVD